MILKYDELFKKLAEYIDDSEAKETLRGLSVLKTFDTEFIQDLIEDCRQNRTLRLSYRTPQAKMTRRKKFVHIELFSRMIRFISTALI